MANLFGSEGLPGPALHIKASTRKGSPNFTDTIQDAIKAAYGDQLVSIGGVFLIKRGRASLHVMPDSPKTPLAKRKDVGNWLRRSEFDAPLIYLSVPHSVDDQDCYYGESIPIVTQWRVRIIVGNIITM